MKTSTDGNGMFRSIGNLSERAPTRLLVIDFEQPGRLHVKGPASVRLDDHLRREFTGAQIVVRVRATHTFQTARAASTACSSPTRRPNVPRAVVEPPVPAWKRFEVFSDILPRED